MTMTEPLSDRLEQGARNLLIDCAGLVPGDSLLLVHEDAALGWWQAELVDTLAAAAERLGIRVRRMQTGPPGNQRDPAVVDATSEHDCTLFLARIGDQDRFGTVPPGQRRVMCYLRDLSMLASSFGRAPYPAMKALKIALDRTIRRADRIDITCPLGTRLSASRAGGGEIADRDEPPDVSILRFPMGIVSPVPAAEFSGRAVVARYLTPTGSAVYDSPVLKVESPVEAIIEHGRISGFEGDAGQVEAIDAHYRRVARLFDLDPFVVHSWHAGIHPGVSCAIEEDENPQLWGHTMFNHPRYLHFHSCGSNPPGEISWMPSDPCVRLDGVPLWKDGRLLVDNFAAARDCLAQWPELRALYGGGD